MKAKKGNRLILFLILVGTILMIWTITNAEMVRLTQPQQTPQNNQTTQITNLGTFWQLTEKAGGLRWAIFAVFVLGIFLVFWKLIELYIEKKRAAELFKVNFRKLSIREISSTIEGQPQNILSRVLAALLNIYQSTGAVANLSEEISTYLKYEQDRFQTFQTRLSFLSDTAGALGLLGTVWGMFLTFFTGNLDKQMILNGMGIALLTTLLGLIVSIILNLSATEVYSLFQKTLDRVAGKSEELRFRLLELKYHTEQLTETTAHVPESVQQTLSLPQTLNSRSQIGDHPKKTKEEEPAKESSHPAEIHFIRAIPPKIKVGNSAIQCICQVKDDDGHPLAGVEVRVEILSGDGKIFGEKRWSGTTGQKGTVAFELVPGKQTGELVCLVKTGENSKLEQTLRTHLVPDSPAKLSILSGNHQSGKIGVTLPKKLRVSVADRYDNPIPDVQCWFKSAKGEGFFDGETNEKAVRTDENGIAETEFTIGQKPGLILVECSVENTDLKENFELFAQED
jgi:biopolymer transport protein ExbB/TolQ